MNVIDALADPKLLGASPAFRDLAPWRPWLVLLRAMHGLPLESDEDLALFTKCTERSTYDPPPGGYAEVVVVVGRQAGKTRIAATLVAHDAATAEPSRDGDYYALLLSQDHRAAIRVAFSYLQAAFDVSPILRREVVSRTSDTIRLRNGVNVAAYPCRPAAIRGLRARVAVCDELAFFRSSDSIPQDLEMLRALRPTLATTGGKLVILSSPYAQSGALYELHRKNFGRDDSPTLVWQASAPTMNPTLAADYLERMREDDPEAYRSEVLGEFRVGITTLFDPDALEACVGEHREFAPSPPPPTTGAAAHGVVKHYEAFVDPSGGRRDAFTCAIAHREGERSVVDVVRAWSAPFNPAAVVAECAELLGRYRVRRVEGDRYAGEWPRAEFRAHQVDYDVARKDRSRLYLDLLHAVNSEAVLLPDVPELLRELRGLERRTGPSGRDRIDHRPGAHDDRANAVAGVVSRLMPGGRQAGLTW